MGMVFGNTGEITQRNAKVMWMSGRIRSWFKQRYVCEMIEKGTRCAPSMMLHASKIVFLSNPIGEGKCPCPSWKRNYIADLER